MCVCVCVHYEFDGGEGAVVEKVAADLSLDKEEKPRKAGGADIFRRFGAAFRHEHPTHTCLRPSPHDSNKGRLIMFRGNF